MSELAASGKYQQAPALYALKEAGNCPACHQRNGNIGKRKAMKYYALEDFELQITKELLNELSQNIIIETPSKDGN